jgi:hypothetical protein
MGFSSGFPFMTLPGFLASDLFNPTRTRPRSEWLTSFAAWAGPASMTQEDKVDRTERMVRDALSGSWHLAGYGLWIIPNGSSPNNTNTKLSSDLDLIVIHEEPWSLPAPGERLPFNTDGRSVVAEHAPFRRAVLSALHEAFDWWNVKEDDKCLRVSATETTRVECDVLPCFRFRQYLPRSTPYATPDYREGVIFVATSGACIISYPEQHLSNGRNKNVATGYRYKQVVRVLKKLKSNFAEAATLLTLEDQPSSFEIESVVYNVPDGVLMHGDLFDAVQGAFCHAAGTLSMPYSCNSLMQANGIERLFPTWSVRLNAFAALTNEGPAEVTRFRRFIQRALNLISDQPRNAGISSVLGSR